jgi:hypothetical protein
MANLALLDLVLPYVLRGENLGSLHALASALRVTSYEQAADPLGVTIRGPRRVQRLADHLRPQPHQLRTLRSRKMFTPTGIRTWTAPSLAHPAPLVAHPLVQQVLMKIQLTGNLSDATMRVDHPMRGLDPVLRGKRSPRSWHDDILPGHPRPAISDVHHFEDVPSSVELRWRPGEHQAALT